jgi:transcription termination factor NusB
MNIHGRIIARKVLLIWFYQKFFLLSSLEKQTVQSDMSRIAKIVAPFADTEQVDSEVVASIQQKKLLDNDEEVPYILANYFSDQDPTQVDYDYIRSIATQFEKNIPSVEIAVNQYATSFKFKDMDVIDQMIFVL